MITLALLLFLQPKPAAHVDPEAHTKALLQLSLATAKRVCAAKVDAQVWLFHGEWDLFPCSRLGEVFALDNQNAVDSVVELIETMPPAKVSK